MQVREAWKVGEVTLVFFKDRGARSGAAAVFRVACSIRRSTPSGAVKACKTFVFYLVYFVLCKKYYIFDL